ncbi:hypothetical protein Y023_5094 [Burkholderia pseudomallei A79D]|nr:hypothetical protein Y023_5094 [Burkholderia pseudomallei A79D]KGX97336.1 hypothetical protein X997_4777 [Burkholderia pseudomallei A79C]
MSKATTGLSNCQSRAVNRPSGLSFATGNSRVQDSLFGWR